MDNEIGCFWWACEHCRHRSEEGGCDVNVVNFKDLYSDDGGDSILCRKFEERMTRLESDKDAERKRVRN